MPIKEAHSKPIIFLIVEKTSYLKFYRASIFFLMGTDAVEYISYFMMIWGGNIVKSGNKLSSCNK